MTTDDILKATEAALGYRFTDPTLLRRALTHASVTERRLDSNERLEFLGDSVLGLVVCERIFQKYPELLEGEMTKIKSAVVSRRTCAIIARELGLDRLLTLGKGMRDGGPLPQSLSAAALEAIIAAIYLDGGYQQVERCLGPLVDPRIDQAAQSGHQQNFKSVLQQHAQQMFKGTPTYRVMHEEGPDHAKSFRVCVELNGRTFACADGHSKKQAEQLAALHALQDLGLVEVLPDGHVRVTPAGVSALGGGGVVGVVGVVGGGGGLNGHAEDEPAK